ncbi:MAG TPA: (Fe-S)-binding protein [Planctomycetes bacterium]|nr:(Fe-S)-binding protein [Planctomycetota bacterium]
MKVALFVPCFVDQLFPEAGLAALEVLRVLGFAPRISGCHCCGQALSNAGDGPGAAALLRAFEAGHPSSETVVVLSASCTEHLAHELDLEAKSLRVLEFCEFLARFGPERYEVGVPKTLLLHQSCSALRGTGTAAATRDLLGRIPGLVVLEPPAAEGECCGFGGSFATTFPELSGAMGRDRLTLLLATAKGDTHSSWGSPGPPGTAKGDSHSSPGSPPAGGPDPGGAGGAARDLDGLVSADLSCLMHLGSLRTYPGWPLLHPAQILREALR